MRCWKIGLQDTLTCLFADSWCRILISRICTFRRFICLLNSSIACYNVVVFSGRRHYPTAQDGLSAGDCVARLSWSALGRDECWCYPNTATPKTHPNVDQSNCQRAYRHRSVSALNIAVVFRSSSFLLTVLGRIECMKCGLLRSMIRASVSLSRSFTWHRCANTAERIEVLLGCIFSFCAFQWLTKAPHLLILRSCSTTISAHIVAWWTN